MATEQLGTAPTSPTDGVNKGYVQGYVAAKIDDIPPPVVQSVPVAALETTGAASSSTYLRGDGAWAAPAGGGGGYSPASILLPVAGATGFGSSIDSQIAAMQCYANAMTHGHLWGGPSPWNSVDVYLSWVETYNAVSTGNVAFSVYLSSVVDGGAYNPQAGLWTNNPTPASGIGNAYHEVLVASNVAVTQDAALTGGVIRYGGTKDTCTDKIGIVGLVIKPSASV